MKIITPSALRKSELSKFSNCLVDEFIGKSIGDPDCEPSSLLNDTIKDDGNAAA